MLARFPPRFRDIARSMFLDVPRRCLPLLYAYAELATVMLVTRLCGYLVADHRFWAAITLLRELDH